MFSYGFCDSHLCFIWLVEMVRTYCQTLLADSHDVTLVILTFSKQRQTTYFIVLKMIFKQNSLNIQKDTKDGSKFGKRGAEYEVC